MSGASEAPSVELHAPDGAFARVYFDGAHVTSWMPAQSTVDRLFVSRRAQYGTGCSIRGGIPVCFPQFGPFGPIGHHGFARLSRWKMVGQDEVDAGARIILRLTDTHTSRKTWPFAFSADLAVHVAAATLTVQLTVTNTDPTPISFTAALHPYFYVENAHATTVRGLAGCRYRDGLRDGGEFDAVNDTLPIEGHIDRVYYATPDVIELREPNRTLRIEKRGFPETVVWNPGAEGTRTRADFADGEELHMVCVEAAVVRPPVLLMTGEQWIGTQVMTAEG
ncbi:D-hexose-6-phosphate mutarotase [Gemmatimonas sp.]|uniref:D-hexose-6-phosphate mutarotase n=1 Tax=Gemmatimonas sp. TaxID=1962908 RepID=UPI0039833F11